MKRLVLAGAVALAGCLPSRTPSWRPTEPSFFAPRAGFEVVPPPGWMRSLRAGPEVLLLTRDGTPLQRISVEATEVGRPIAPGGGGRAVTPGMSSLELAELVVDDLRTSEGITDVRVLEIAPATVSGRSGFRLIASYRGPNGLLRRVAQVGLLEGALFYRLAYVAPERVYFPRDFPLFEAFVQTFRLRPPVPDARPRTR